MSDWDLVLRGGRVIDPESGLDAVQDVAVAQGRIAAIGTALPPGPTDVDVSGQAPGSGRPALNSGGPGRHWEQASNAAKL